MNGNFCTVVMMIFLPASMALRRSPEWSACADRRADLGELLDGVRDLLVEDQAVGHHDDGVEHPLAVVLQADQLVGQPGDGVGLAAARRVLDEVAVPGPTSAPSARSLRTTSSWW